MLSWLGIGVEWCGVRVPGTRPVLCSGNVSCFVFGWDSSTLQADLSRAVETFLSQYTLLLLLLYSRTGPRRALSLKLSDTRVYEPEIRTRLGRSSAHHSTLGLRVIKKKPSRSVQSRCRANVALLLRRVRISGS